MLSYVQEEKPTSGAAYMQHFNHEKLDVYQVAIEFVMLTEAIIERLPRGRACIADQLQRASLSVPLNIAEGAGEYSSAEKIRFYRIARRSATECASILDICARLRLLPEEQYAKGRELLLRLVAMLTKMAQAASFVNVPVPEPDLKNPERAE